MANEAIMQVDVLVIGGGPAGLAAAIAAYDAFLDGEYGGRIYFAAPKLEQAALCFEAFHQMILQEDELNAMVQKRRTDIYIAESNTTAKALAQAAKKLNISATHTFTGGVVPI